MDDRSEEQDREELLWKYEEMRALRVDGGGADHEPRIRLAALAARFPGALRELDQLPMEEIERRIGALQAGQPGTEWMVVQSRYHRLLRGALAAKRRTKNLDGEASSDAALWSDSLGELSSLPGGRISAVVVRRIASEMGRSAPEIRAILHPFASRRPRDG